MVYDVIIPARWESTRLAGKMLIDLAGKPLIQRVYEQVRKSKARRVVIATDHEDILKVGEGFGAECVLTGREHRSGSERLAEVVQKGEWQPDDVIVNVQGDEPFIDPLTIDVVANTLLTDVECGVSTAATIITNESEYLNKNVVKVVTDHQGYALYFSRAPIPAYRDDRRPLQPLRHMGIYGFRAGFISGWNSLPESELEQAESLEQLRVLAAGEKIRVSVVDESIALGIDTEEDLEKARQLLALSQ